MSSKTNKKKPLVPKLRFPEFRGAGEWEVKQLGEVCSFLKGKGLPKTAITPHGVAPCIHYGELFTDYGEVIRDTKSYTDSTNNCVKSEEEDVLMPTSDVTPNGLAKASCIKEKGVVLGGDILIIRANKQLAFGEFLSRYIRYKEQDVLRYVSGTTVFHLYSSSISKLKIALPELEEQQRIAACLSSLDEVINLQAQKLEALKQHKKGLMQQLFPAEGETTPRLRFPEFRDAGAWEVKRLGDVATIHKGKGVSKADISPDGALPCIRYGELYTYYGETIAEAVSRTDVPPSELVLSHANDVIIPASGETQEDIATASCVLHAGIALGGDLNIIRAPIDGVFLSYYLNGTKRRAIAQVAQGNSVVHLYPAQLGKLKISIPKPQEQQKIANCLSSLDEVIDLQAQKVEALKQHKKGLMQQIFPQEVA